VSAAPTTPEVVVVGLGPGDERYLTAAALDAIRRGGPQILRTARHPTAALLDGAQTCDDLYEHAATFDDVYRAIGDRVATTAQRNGSVLYAVPGSPLVLERTVAHLRSRSDVSCRVLPALSFLDLAYERLGIDPVEAGLRLVDGHRFATTAAGERGPLLVAHCHANWVLSEIKLAAETSGDDEVWILQRLGTPDETVVRTTWADLDRTVEADHLTSLYVPRLTEPVAMEYARFHALARTLRERCPWDREQTHGSLVRYLVEEAYEAVDAIEALDPDDPATDDHLVEELGDLLYQIEFHAVIAEQEGRFSMADVARSVHDKLVFRHPHVFADASDDAAEPTPEELTATWDGLKQQEKGRTSLFEGIPRHLPALMAAAASVARVQRAGRSLGPLDTDTDAVAAVRRLAETLAVTTESDTLGELLLAAVALARHRGVDPEHALRTATTRFRQAHG
jgi:tetrapyrrole methylase family protein/MazG family protein